MQSNRNQRSDMQQSRNIAARAGRWSARHRKTAILGWIVFVVLAFMVGNNMGTETLTQEQSGVGDSGTAAQIVKDAYPEKHDEMVLIQSKSLEDRRPGVPGRGSRRDPAPRGHEGRDRDHRSLRQGRAAHAISDDGHSALVSFEIKGDTEDARP